jgi:hypothetical protein
MEKRAIARQDSINEILVSERSYLAQLDTLLKVGALGQAAGSALCFLAGCPPNRRRLRTSRHAYALRLLPLAGVSVATGDGMSDSERQYGHQQEQDDGGTHLNRSGAGAQ